MPSELLVGLAPVVDERWADELAVDGEQANG